MKPTSKPKPKFSVYFYNWTTYAGVILSLVIVTIELFMIALDLLAPNGSTYVGLITYLILPPFLILGLILIPVGALIKWYKVIKGHEDIRPKTYYFDPALPSHRNGLYVFMVGTSIFILMSAVGSYKAFNHLESVKFCGQTCHYIMKPEYTAYLQSPHARVKCVECHVGEGAEHYLQTKITGAMQAIDTIRNVYPKPIPTPVHNLRPAKETCEHCHWPGKYFGALEFHKNYFPVDEYPAKSWKIRMLLRVGGDEAAGVGVHAHMYSDNTIYYVSDDPKRQSISWVKSVAKNGTSTVYKTDKSPYKDEAPAPDKVRAMDCIDCHNRPSHNFRAPSVLIDEALFAGTIDPSIPKVKEKAMAILSVKYTTEAEAVARIPVEFRNYYRSKQREFYARNVELIDRAANNLVEIFKKNFFPEMKARWDEYPVNIGHMIAPGCFRCHDGEHKSVDGKVISRDCKICHVIIEQGPPGATEKNVDGLEFRHPFNGDESWKEMNCNDCHTGN